MFYSFNISRHKGVTHDSPFQFLLQNFYFLLQLSNTLSLTSNKLFALVHVPKQMITPQTQFYLKALMAHNDSKPGIRGNFLNQTKGIYENIQLRSYFMVKDWKLPPQIRNNARVSTLVSSTKCFARGMVHARKEGRKDGRGRDREKEVGKAYK